MVDRSPRARRPFGEWLATKLAGDPTTTGPVRDIDGDVLDLTVECTIISFWAPWCGPCRMMRPLVDELATAREDDERLEFVRVNVDTSTQIAERFRVMSVPTLVALDADGTERARLPGLVPQRQLESFVDHLE